MQELELKKALLLLHHEKQRVGELELKAQVGEKAKALLFAAEGKLKRLAELERQVESLAQIQSETQDQAQAYQSLLLRSQTQAGEIQALQEQLSDLALTLERARERNTDQCERHHETIQERDYLKLELRRVARFRREAPRILEQNRQARRFAKECQEKLEEAQHHLARRMTEVTQLTEQVRQLEKAQLDSADLEGQLEAHRQRIRELENQLIERDAKIEQYLGQAQVLSDIEQKYVQLQQRFNQVKDSLGL